jgi:hypothetical protein
MYNQFTKSGMSKIWILFLIIVLGLCIMLPRIVMQNLMKGHYEKYVAVVKHDMRFVINGIEAYYADHKEFPSMRSFKPLNNKHGDLIDRYDFDFSFVEPGGLPDGPLGVTTPVAYITSIPRDAFAPNSISFGYFSDSVGWILFSPGPDKDYDIDPVRDYDGSTTQPSLHLLTTATYDPTNGARSDGDIWRVHQ